MRGVNLTPHAVVVFRSEDTERDERRVLHPKDGATPILSTQPSGTIARAAERSVPLDDVEVDGVSIPVTRKTFVLPVTGLPEPEDGTFYVVSQITAAAVPDRDDVFFAGEAVRNGEGQIIGCVGLSRV